MDIIVWNMKQLYEGRECLGPMLGSGRLEGSRRHWLKMESRGEEGGGTSKLNSFSLHNFASCHLRVVFCLNVFNKAVTKLVFSSAYAHSLTSMGPACLKETNITVVLFTLSRVIVRPLVCQGHTLNCIARSLLSSWGAVTECWIPKCGLEVFHMDSYSPHLDVWKPLIPGHKEDGRGSWWQMPRCPSHDLSKIHLGVSFVDCLDC